MLKRILIINDETDELLCECFTNNRCDVIINALCFGVDGGTETFDTKEAAIEFREDVIEEYGTPSVWDDDADPTERTRAEELQAEIDADELEQLMRD